MLLFFGDYFQPLAYLFQPEQIKTFLEKAAESAPIACMIFMTLAVMIPFIPSLSLDIAAGAQITNMDPSGATKNCTNALKLSNARKENYGKNLIEKSFHSLLYIRTPHPTRWCADICFISSLLAVLNSST